MLFRNLTPDGDWTFGAGLSNLASKNDAIALNIKTRIQSWVGDCFFDMRAGIDWVNRLGSKSQRSLLEQDLRRIILRSDGVSGITEFSSVLNGRKFVANYSVSTIYGTEFKDIVSLEV